ncbi:MAG: zinc ribbon domain-containing protein [Myxococcales bacterium]|nr:zinc ribbon domain-containing protein [Myxococcales bacterium]
MSEREESVSKSKRKSGSKADKRAKSGPKKDGKRRSGSISTDPPTAGARRQDELERPDSSREYRSSRTKAVVASEPAAPTKLDEVFEVAGRHKVWAVPIILVVALGTGLYAGVGTALLVLAGSFLLLVISAFWASVQSLTGEADLNLDEALSLAAPSAELEQKRATLRALKDLEFEHNIGKISDADYKDLSARYRAEAKRLLQQLSDVEGESRKRAEQLFKLKLLEADPDARLVYDEETEDALSELSAENRERVEGVLMQAALNAAKSKARGQRPADDHAAEDEADEAGAQATEDADDDTNLETDPAEDLEQPAEEAGEVSPDGEAADEGFVDDPVRTPPVSGGPSRRCKVCETRNPLENTRCSGCNSHLAEANQILCSACPAVYPDSQDACPVCGVAAPVEQD